MYLAAAAVFWSLTVHVLRVVWLVGLCEQWTRVCDVQWRIWRKVKDLGVETAELGCDNERHCRSV